MQIKRFEAETVSRALRAVKAELGPNAVILETRKIALGGGKGVQVTAAFEATTPAAKPSPLVALPAEGPHTLVDPPWAKTATTRAERNPNAANIPTPVATVSLADVTQAIAPLRDELSAFGDRLNGIGKPSSDGEWATMRDEISDLKALVNNLVVDRRVAALPDTLRPLYLNLTSKGLPRDTAAELIANLPDGDPQRITETIADRIRISGPLTMAENGPTKVLFAGPTGVGKTTTIAKLAAHFAINEQRKVALITLDTFRIGAVEQLTTYANIIGIPSAVAADNDALQAELATFSDMDMVLIDTAGRSPREPGHIDDLKALDLDGIAVQLVLPATLSLSDLSTTLAAYRSLAPTGLVLTKLDETNQLGAALHTVINADIPVSYLTNGQRIPEDLQLASGARLATQFLS